LHKETSTVPIVFTLVSDPLGGGFVAGLPHPGGNITGFVQTDGALGGKWLNLLKEIAPGIKRAAIMYNPDTAPDHGNFFLGSFETAAQTLALEPVRLQVRSDTEIENAVGALGREQGGLVLMDDSFMAVHCRTAIAATLRDKVPALSVLAQFTKDGGLMSYVSSIPDQFRGAAGYVDTILRGEKPATSRYRRRRSSRPRSISRRPKRSASTYRPGFSPPPTTSSSSRRTLRLSERIGPSTGALCALCTVPLSCIPRADIGRP
jgi:putative ABC transport system substrate-binding protein